MSFKIPDTPEELFRQGRKNLGLLNQLIPFVVVVVLLLGVVLSSFYSVGPDEVGIVQRFGQYNRTESPGLHWKLPFQIEHASLVKVQKIFKEEFGFRTVQGGVKTQYSSRSFEDESLMLTGDLNVLNVLWTVQYKIQDPKAWLFHIRNPRLTIRDLSETMMRQVIGDNSLSEALNLRRIEIGNEVKERLQQALNEYESGVHVQTIELKEVNVADPVKASFNEVNQAEQEKNKVRNQAREAYNKVIPKARGEAEKTIQESEGYAFRRINEAKGDAAKFLSVYTAYKEAKDITRKRLYLETMAEMLPKAGKIYVSDPRGQSILPLLNLSGEVKP